MLEYLDNNRDTVDHGFIYLYCYGILWF